MIASLAGVAADIAAGLAVGVGAFFLATAAIGVVRMPDTYLRMSAASKASSLGAGLVLLATAIASGDLWVAARALAGILFLLLTVPVASHMLGRAAYLTGVPQAPGTRVDELAGRYDLPAGRLKGCDEP